MPFEGSGSEILVRKCQEDPPSADEFVTGTPEDLNRLCKELLRRDPMARPSGREILDRLSGDEAVVGGGIVGGGIGLDTTSDDIFVGRERYLQAMLEAFEEMRGGRPSVLHLYARSGLGKTSLLENFLRQLVDRRDTLVFRSLLLRAGIGAL